MNTQRRDQITAIAAVLGAATAIALGGSSAAEAKTCSQWAFAKHSTFTQANGWVTSFLNAGEKVSGEAHSWAPTRVSFLTGGDMEVMHGRAQGQVTGSAIHIRVKWNNGPVGIYDGSVNNKGHASGYTYDEKAPEAAYRWKVDKPLRCVKA